MQARLCSNIGEDDPERGVFAENKKMLDRLLLDAYNALYRIASGYLRRERSGHTLENAALVHEAYLRLVRQKSIRWCNRDQLLGLASRMMRRILVDHARGLQFAKHGGRANRVSLEEALAVPGSPGPGVEMLWECLASLAAIEPQQARIVELRYFDGLTAREIADRLDLSTATVTRRWHMARCWLFHELTGKVSPQTRTTVVHGAG